MRAARGARLHVRRWRARVRWKETSPAPVGVGNRGAEQALRERVRRRRPCVTPQRHPRLPWARMTASHQLPRRMRPCVADFLPMTAILWLWRRSLRTTAQIADVRCWVRTVLDGILSHVRFLSRRAPKNCVRFVEVASVLGVPGARNRGLACLKTDLSWRQKPRTAIPTSEIVFESTASRVVRPPAWIWLRTFSPSARHKRPAHTSDLRAGSVIRQGASEQSPAQNSAL